MTTKTTPLIRSLGALALGTRLRMVSDLLVEQAAEVYAANGIEFNPRLFGAITVLAKKGPCSIVDLSSELRVSHPAAVQTSNVLLKESLAKSSSDSEDGRKKLLSLTAKAQALTASMEPVWKELKGALETLLAETTPSLLSDLEALEDSLQSRPLTARVKNTTHISSADDVKIITWDPKFRASFADLNTDWITKYFALEKSDRAILENPEREILKKRGMVFFAKAGPLIVGTCALIARGTGRYELAKMAVATQFQGKGIAQKLLHASEQWAKKHGGKILFLESSTKLTRALELYRRWGFEHLPPPQKSAYARVDVYMEKKL